MKTNLHISLLIILIALLNGCDQPAPTELINDMPDNSSELQIEVLGGNVTDEYYSDGFDTTGVDFSARAITNLVSVSGIKVTYKNTTIESSLAQARFLDKSKPIKNSDGIVIGYQSSTPGIVLFNNKIANIVPYRIRFRSKGVLSDTLIGQRYQLFSGWLGHLDPFGFNYSSNVNFKLNPLAGSSINFDVPTLQQITAVLHMSGSLTSKNLVTRVEWDNKGSQGVELIIGVVPKNSSNTYPLFRIRSRDTGLIKIPQHLLNDLPAGRFSHFVLSLKRKVEFIRTGGNQEINVLSQSIHTIKAEIP